MVSGRGHLVHHCVVCDVRCACGVNEVLVPGTASFIAAWTEDRGIVIVLDVISTFPKLRNIFFDHD